MERSTSTLRSRRSRSPRLIGGSMATRHKSCRRWFCSMSLSAPTPSSLSSPAARNAASPGRRYRAVRSPLAPSMASFRIMPSTCPRSSQRDAAGDHADVAEGLREVTDELARRRVDLLRQQAERARPCTERRVEVLRLVEAPLTDEIYLQPEAAQQEGALVAGYAVGRVVMTVPVQEAAARGEAVDDGAGRGRWPAGTTWRSGSASRLASTPPPPRCSHNV